MTEFSRFYLGILIFQCLIFLILFNVYIEHPKIIEGRLWIIVFTLILGLIGIICNCYNAFPIEKKVNEGVREK